MFASMSGEDNVIGFLVILFIELYTEFQRKNLDLVGPIGGM